MIILIGGEKGGSGKSCLARNLAVWLKLQNKDVTLIDGDPQGSTYKWNEIRKKNEALPQMSCWHVSGKISRELQDLSKKTDIVLIDTGGQDSPTLRSAMIVANRMLVPTGPTYCDLETMPHVRDIVDEAKCTNPDLYVRSVLTKCPSLPSQVREILEAKEVCEGVGISPLQAFTSYRKIYNTSKGEGRGVLECDDPKAAAEINEIAEEFFSWAS